MSRYLALVVLIGAFLFSACGGSEDCIVLANGGNKLCGSDAAAWCESTDGIRDTANTLDPGNADVRESQSVCDDLNEKYGSDDGDPDDIHDLGF